MSISEAQRKASDNYKRNNIKRIPLDVQKEKYEQIKAAADTCGETVNGYIKTAIEMRLNQ